MADKKTVRDEAPPPHDEGQYVAICVDVIDLGMNVEKFGEKPAELKDKTALVFKTEFERDGKPQYIAQEFSTSMGKKSNMRKFLEGWRGKPYTEDEAKKQGIPLDKLEGVGALVTIAHKTSAKGNTYAVIQTIVPLPRQMRDGLPDAKDYERLEFWAKKKAEYAAAVTTFTQGKPQGGTSTTTTAEPEHEREDDDSDLPF